MLPFSLNSVRVALKNALHRLSLLPDRRVPYIQLPQPYCAKRLLLQSQTLTSCHSLSFAPIRKTVRILTTRPSRISSSSSCAHSHIIWSRHMGHVSQDPNIALMTNHARLQSVMRSTHHLFKEDLRISCFRPCYIRIAYSFYSITHTWNCKVFNTVYCMHRLLYSHYTHLLVKTSLAASRQQRPTTANTSCLPHHSCPAFC